MDDSDGARRRQERLEERTVVARTIREARQWAGLSQAELARLMTLAGRATTRSMVSRWEALAAEREPGAEPPAAAFAPGAYTMLLILEVTRKARDARPRAEKLRYEYREQIAVLEDGFADIRRRLGGGRV